MSSITREQVLAALSHVNDPDLMKDLVTLNMVKDIAIEGNKVSFSVELTTPACPLKDLIQNACVNAIKHFISKDAEVVANMTSRVTSLRSGAAVLPGVKNIIAVASGKGGVGKSTVSANLALSLAAQGAKVGLLDADIYGPSIPTLFGCTDKAPDSREEDGRSIMIPIEKYGVKLLSIGFMVQPGQAVVWRGPMVSSAMRQFVNDVDWGDLDYLIIDLPPGTGDIHLTMAQIVPVTGVVIVTTPQEVALADARKAIGMFGIQGITLPIIGIVENMAYFVPPDDETKKYYIFGQDGGKQLAQEYKLPFLGEIPLVQTIREAGDEGIALKQKDAPTAQAFTRFAELAAQQIAILNSTTQTNAAANS
jgi:ATP-binding protein involved in chromosome partitioning